MSTVSIPESVGLSPPSPPARRTPPVPRTPTDPGALARRFAAIGVVVAVVAAAGVIVTIGDTSTSVSLFGATDPLIGSAMEREGTTVPRVTSEATLPAADEVSLIEVLPPELPRTRVSPWVTTRARFATPPAAIRDTVTVSLPAPGSRRQSDPVLELSPVVPRGSAFIVAPEPIPVPAVPTVPSPPAGPVPSTPANPGPANPGPADPGLANPDPSSPGPADPGPPAPDPAIPPVPMVPPQPTDPGGPIVPVVPTDPVDPVGPTPTDPPPAIDPVDPGATVLTDPTAGGPDGDSLPFAP